MMTKTDFTMLKIDPDFQKLIPPLEPEEFRQLEQNILSDKQCRDGILVWKDTIVDGHNRYEICQKHSIPFEVSKISFSSKKDALIWIAENQLGRRNLTKAARIELAFYKGEMLRQKAKENQSAAGGDMRDAKELAGEPVHVRKSIAASAGVGEGTVQKYMKIMGKGTPELIEQVREGKVKIGTAYNQLKMETKTVKVIFDDSDKINTDSVLGRKIVMGYIDSAVKLYRFIDETVSVAEDMRGLEKVRKRLEKQLEVIEGLVG